jgi:hypothetical protein
MKDLNPLARSSGEGSTANSKKSMLSNHPAGSHGFVAIGLR